MILIIGYGNPLRGDDALGQITAGYLAQRFQEDTDVHVRAVHQLTPELAMEIADYEMIILIDAFYRAPAGQIIVEDVQLAIHSLSHSFSHYLTPSKLLLLTNVLYGSSPRMISAGITATTFDVGKPLSAGVRVKLPSLYEKIIALVHGHESL